MDSEKRQQLKSEPLEIDVEQTVNYARQLERERVAFEESVAEIVAGESTRNKSGSSENRVCHVEYEELLQDETKTMNRVLPFLDADTSLTMKSYVEKATSNDLREAVTNYEKLVAAVKGTELEQFLEG